MRIIPYEKIKSLEKTKKTIKVLNCIKKNMTYEETVSYLDFVKQDKVFTRIVYKSLEK